jgi:peptidoglycan/xylan/chitin deacetylase (PgdA/CDA1 family)
MLHKTKTVNTFQRVSTNPPLSWKRNLLLSLEEAMYLTGAGFAYRKVQQARGAIILCYHSVAPAELSPWIDPNCHLRPEIFEAHLRFLSRYRQVIALEQLIELLEQGRTPAAGTVVLTFDDGYLDNLTEAAPLLARYGLPATCYLPTGMIERGENPWINRMYTAFKTRTQDKLSIEGLGNWHLLNSAQQLKAYTQLRERLIELNWLEREGLLAKLIEQLQPAERPPRLILSWDEVRETVRQFPNIELGTHSVNHLDLSRQSQTVVYSEIENCSTDFQRELGQRPRHFCFPYNRSNLQTSQAVQQLGYRSAMAAGSEPLVGHNTDRFALTRVETPASLTLLKFYTSGAFPGLPKTLVGRAA